ncbi:hypothetical protein EJ06DRAFT_64883 [Trichodelitschia bisporula]|uniref:Uncharacterized protein n=1 Tax=Trichodelitschia bisporula TaxID=703511 RepID=A0A6G1HTC2_9PEZI|nr:hypothetical protein EJ06DRAFT_64883 [Trichodelitschia bisporula]
MLQHANVGWHEFLHQFPHGRLSVLSLKLVKAACSCLKYSVLGGSGGDHSARAFARNFSRSARPASSLEANLLTKSASCSACLRDYGVWRHTQAVVLFHGWIPSLLRERGAWLQLSD